MLAGAISAPMAQETPEVPLSGAAAAVEAVKGRAEALLGKFRAFSTRPKQGAAGPAAP